MNGLRGRLVWWVARKELLSTIRDRRAIVSNLLIPLLLLPVLMLGLPLAMGGLFEREQEATTAIGIEGAANLPDPLRDALAAERTELVPTNDALQQVREDEVAAALVLPANVAAELRAGQTPRIRIVRKAGNLQSELAAGKVERAVQSYREGIVAERLAEVGLDRSVLEPFALDTRDASRPEERSSGQLAFLVPFFIAVWALAGGQMVAIDATAGEKERGTLEALLVAPVRRSEIVAGKFLATLATGLSAAFMAILGVVLGGALLRGVFLPRLGEEATEMAAVMGGAVNLRPEGFWILLGSALLLAAAVAALLMAVAMFARSFKEAQSYVAPLSFVMIVPALALQFKDLLDLGTGVYLVPVVNVMVLMDDVLAGAARAGDVLAAWGTMAGLVVLLLGFALRNFRREGVIFRT